METCPYCKKVMKYFEEHHIQYEKHDITESKNLEELIEIGGTRQVPFLVDTDKGVNMYESDDIIEYVKGL